MGLEVTGPLPVGEGVTGAFEGFDVGCVDGDEVGFFDGCVVGASLGAFEGCVVGSWLGAFDGLGVVLGGEPVGPEERQNSGV